MIDSTTREVRIRDAAFGGGHLFSLIAGPCVIEDEETVLNIARRLEQITAELSIPFVFKSSYDKANRSSIASYRGPGIERGLEILWKVKRECGCPVLSDVHSVEEINAAAEVLDAIQIPAFLCRQTDLVVAAAKTGKPVNIKKGQFLSPGDMANIVEKAASTGNEQILLTERGTTFGYNNLVVDFRALPQMRALGYPVIFDATHAVQLPGGRGTSTGGQREFIAPLVRAAMAAGCDGLFLEVHDEPDKALSDAASMLALADLPDLLRQAKELDQFVKRGA